MSLNANNSKNKGSFADPVPAGNYPARLVVVADLGLQPQEYQGEKKNPAYEILTTYELLDEFLKDENGEDDKSKPRWVSENFVLYPLTSKKAKSTDRYLVVDPTGQHNGRWDKCIGVPVMVTVVVNVAKNGRSYNNISNTAPMRAKEVTNAPKLVNKPVIFDMDNPDLDSFKALPQWVQKRIFEGLEFKGSKLEAMYKEQPNEPAKEETDDRPF